MPNHELSTDPLEQSLGWLVDRVTAGSHEYSSGDEQPIIFRINPDQTNRGIIFHSRQVPGVELLLGEDQYGHVYFADEGDDLRRQQRLQRAFDRLHEVLNETKDSRVREGFGTAMVYKRFDDLHAAA